MQLEDEQFQAISGNHISYSRVHDMGHSHWEAVDESLPPDAAAAVRWTEEHILTHAECMHASTFLHQERQATQYRTLQYIVPLV